MKTLRLGLFCLVMLNILGFIYLLLEHYAGFSWWWFIPFLCVGHVVMYHWGRYSEKVVNG